MQMFDSLMNILSRGNKSVASIALAAAAIFGCASPALADGHTPENRVIYEVFVRNFSPEGNFKGVERQIPRLKELGVDVIWLMPIYKLGDVGKWGTYSSPYAVKDYKAIDPDNGSAADLRSLISAIHAAGMEVWFDWVGNHTSKDNVWVSSHPEYYGNNFYSPNGWNDVYQLDINNAAMHEAMIDAMQYWVSEFDIDGYRCDYASGPSEEFWRKATSRVLKNGRRIAWLAEDNSKPQLVGSCGFDYNYAYEFYYDGLKRFADGGSLSDLRRACTDLHSNGSYSGKSRMVYTSNHDIVQDLGGTEDRFLHKYLRPLTVLQFTVYGMPLIYNGQEIQYKSGAVMLSEKTPIDWSHPDNSMTDLYRQLIKLKHEHPALRTGNAQGTLTNLTTSADDRVYAYMRGRGEGAVVVLLNFDDRQRTFTVQGLPNARLTDCFSGRTANLGADNSFTLPAQGYAVYSASDIGSLPEPETYKLYIEDRTGWNSLHVYGWWENRAELYGGWPGIKAEETAVVGGRRYYVVDIPVSANGMSYNLIFNNGVGGQTGQYDIFDVALDKNYYFVANPTSAQDITGDVLSGVEEISSAEDSSADIYYTLQGVRVAAPEAGRVYIRVRAGKASKVAIHKS